MARIHAIRGRTACTTAANIGTPVFDLPSAMRRSSFQRSAADCQRSSGSFSRQVWMARSSAGGVRGCSLLTGFGCLYSIADATPKWLLPSKARPPVTISYSTAPNEKMSLRASASFPSTCSGDIYGTVPTTAPSSVIGVARGVMSVNVASAASGSAAFANPKSSSLAPDFVSMMLPGLRSRCVTPLRRALSRALAIWIPHSSTSATGIGPFSNLSASDSPSRYSMTRKSTPSCCPMSYRVQMEG